MKFRFTDHALQEIAKRRIPIEIVNEVLDAPEQIVPGRRGRNVYQSRKVFSNGGTYLVRVIVEMADVPPTIRTVYRTSKIVKYWRPI